MEFTQSDLANDLVEYLWRVARLNAKQVRRLVPRFQDLKTLLQVPEPALLQELDFLPNPNRASVIAALREHRATGSAIPYCSYLSPAYPSRLGRLFDPPCGFYYRGRLGLLHEPGPWIGIVGTRQATAYALNFCEHLVSAMRSFQPVVVSGLALGIDGMAHRSALRNEIRTVAVLGTDLDRIHPVRHLDLARQMVEKGLLLSELASGTPVAAWHFPQRNRLIAALVDLLVVVEAPEKSGALLTAQFALELGKEIYVVPGQAGSPQNRGGHRLIQEGARLLMDPEEIFIDLGLIRPPKRASRGETPADATPKTNAPAVERPEGDERKILEILRLEALHVDKIIAMSHLPTPLVTGLLMRLILEGLVEEMPGNCYSLKPFARELLSKP